MAAASSTAAIDLSRSENVSTAAHPEAIPFTVGQLVDVESRTWPGINQPGGIGRVTGIAASCASVMYLVGHRRHEKEIPFRFIKPYTQTTKRLRNRSMLLGRCQNCGSLRADCGSCDIWAAERQLHLSVGSAADTSTKKASHKESTDSLEDSDSTASSALEEDIARRKRRFRKYQRLKRDAQRLLGDEELSLCSKCDSESDSSGGEDDFPLRQLVWQASQPAIHEKLSESSSWRKRQKRTPVKDSSNDDESSLAVSEGSLSGDSMMDFDKDLDSVSSPTTRDSSPTGKQQLPPTGKQQLPPTSYVATRYCAFSSDDDCDDARFAGFDMNLTQNDFIQPEGNANNLPRDVIDRTASLPYSELAPFFDSAVGDIETEKLGSAQRQINELEQILQGGDDPEMLHNQW